MRCILCRVQPRRGAGLYCPDCQRAVESWVMAGADGSSHAIGYADVHARNNLVCDLVRHYAWLAGVAEPKTAPARWRI